jgi:hypothetical protein
VRKQENVKLYMHACKKNTKKIQGSTVKTSKKQSLSTRTFKIPSFSSSVTFRMKTAGFPAQSSPSGTTVSGSTTAPAAMMQFFPMSQPSWMMEPWPTREPSPTMQDVKRAPWPTVTCHTIMKIKSSKKRKYKYTIKWYNAL